ncbi:MASE1 domain-containing protein [Shinella kummerowiae]|uniref:MASE1 domain-containing protein n=1 Tax=Shinella kummerowiae TaxID=417745 RepID=UPI0021B5DC59|nr:MASE1 domain-containing protein [Shinella kummerowiae]MCT7663857.1 MASE1 domain-containing protein [Shinella kummerowiae]
MTSVWSHRPSLLHLALFGVTYVLAAGFAQLLAIVPGTGISIWPPSGLFVAALILVTPPSWPWWVLAGFLGEFSANVLWFHNPLPVAMLIYTGNALEAMVGAWLVKRTCGRPVRMETVQEVVALIVMGAGAAPIISATMGSATLAWFGMQPFTRAWPLWWIGDATGVLIVAPLALVVFQSWRGDARLSAARWTEAGILGTIFLAVAGLSLSGYLPFAYIIMPPLLWAAVRFEFKGAVITLALLALITAAFTVSGVSQFAGDPESQRHKQIMLQLFLVISAFSALIVAAISRQYQRALLTLRESERQLQQLIDAVPTLIWCATPKGIPCYLNKRAMDVIGATVKDLLAPDGSRSLTIVHPEDRDAAEKAYAHAFETGEPLLWRYRQRRANGSHRWVESRAEALRDETGAIVQWYGVSVDIEDMMKAQEALRERERELSQLVEMVPVHIRRLTPEGNPTFFNKRLLDFFGLDSVSELDKPGLSRLTAAIEALVHPEDAGKLLATVQKAVATGEPFSLKYRMLHADGTYRWVDGRGEAVRDEHGEIVQWYAVSLDIDDQVRSREELSLAQENLAIANRAASLAELSASIAHEVNQPLTAVVANSLACQRWLSAEPPHLEKAQKTLGLIVRAANSATDIVSHTRALFRRTASTRTSTMPDSVITEAHNLMAEEAARRRVRVTADVERDLPPVSLDRVQIQQVLINLLRNGMDAVEAITGDRTIGIRMRRMGGVVQTEISDHGPGIEHPEKVFEPFFTTKAHGMGMGLAICRSIVESHGGRLWAEANEPQGAIFIFTLPIEGAPAS